MKHLILLLLFSTVLSSCSMTGDEIKEKKKMCDELGLEFVLIDRPLIAKCETKQIEYTQVDLEQIEYCREKGLNFERSGWDSEIKCITIK